jgi:hypothetical protein
MGIRFTRTFSALASALFCTLAFSSALPEAGQPLSFNGPDERGILIAAADPVGDTSLFDIANGGEAVSPEPLLLAVNDDGRVCRMRLGFLPGEWNCKNYTVNKVYVCHVKKNGKFKTKYLPEENAQKKVDKNPDEWILGKCEDVVSPS